MEVLLERLFLELTAIAVQVAIMQIIKWLQQRREENDGSVGLNLAA